MTIIDWVNLFHAVAAREVGLETRRSIGHFLFLWTDPMAAAPSIDSHEGQVDAVCRLVRLILVILCPKSR